MSEIERSDLAKGAEIGSKMMVALARGGSLRLDPLPFERGQYPYTTRLRPVKATILIWKAWWAERRSRGRTETGTT